jgi:hypothetical protein
LNLLKTLVCPAELKPVETFRVGVLVRKLRAGAELMGRLMERPPPPPPPPPWAKANCGAKAPATTSRTTFPRTFFRIDDMGHLVFWLVGSFREAGEHRSFLS